jgi:hypothetical protein
MWQHTPVLLALQSRIMKANGKEILRWTAIAVFGGLGVWMLLVGLPAVVSFNDGNWFGAFFVLGFLVSCATPCFAVAYICFRRRYRELFNVLGAVGAIIIFGVLILLPNHWHVNEFFVRRALENPLFAFSGLVVSLLCLFVPFYGATWFYRFCHRLAQHRSPQSGEPTVIGSPRSS